MTYAQLLGNVASGPHRLGVETSVWCPILLAASVALLVAGFRLLARCDDDQTDSDLA